MNQKKKIEGNNKGYFYFHQAVHSVLNQFTTVAVELQCTFLHTVELIFAKKVLMLYANFN